MHRACLGRPGVARPVVMHRACLCRLADARAGVRSGATRAAATAATRGSRLWDTVHAYYPLNAPGTEELSNTRWDYVVVGSGSAGSVLAGRLSEDPTKKVLLLEAGPRDISPWIHVPIGYFKTVGSRRHDWRYRVEGASSGLNGRNICWPRGKVLGGSSSINGLLYVRGQPEDYDDWAADGNEGWSWSEILPYFRKAEDNERCDTSGFEAELHGSGGPQSVSSGRLKTEVAERWIDACSEALDVPRVEDPNGRQTACVGYFQQITTGSSFRCSSAVGYVHRVRHERPNLRVLPAAEVTDLLLEGGQDGGAAAGPLRAAGVRLGGDRWRRRPDGVEVRVDGGGEVLLAAGALGSPKLLMQAGVGDPEALQKAGISTRHGLPGVGRNLQDHLQFRPKFRCDYATLNTYVNAFFGLGQIAIGLEYILRGTGPMSMAASQVCAFARSREGLTRPDIQFHFQPLSTSGSPAVNLDKFDAFTASVCQLRPESRGSLELLADGQLAIHANYLATDEDQRVAIDSVKAARKVSARLNELAGRARVEEDPGSRDLQSDDEILDWCRSNAETIYHPTGTCKMGPKSDPEAVVDPRLRVYGVQSLRVVDCSAMPRLVSGNTHAPAQMMAEKAADMIKDDAAAA